MELAATIYCAGVLIAIASALAWNHYRDPIAEENMAPLVFAWPVFAIGFAVMTLSLAAVLIWTALCDLASGELTRKNT